MITKQKLLNQLPDAIKELQKLKCGCYHWHLDIDDDENDWAIVLGWQDGYGEDPNDPCEDEGWHLCMKVAFQSKRSIMQCDYDVDWMMPYNEETGEVDNMEVTIYQDDDFSIVVDWLWKHYLRLKKEKEY